MTKVLSQNFMFNKQNKIEGHFVVQVLWAEISWLKYGAKGKWYERHSVHKYISSNVNKTF